MHVDAAYKESHVLLINVESPVQPSLFKAFKVPPG